MSCRTSRSQSDGQRDQSVRRAPVVIDEEQLIMEVENHSILYDTNHPFYKDCNRKEKTWCDVAALLRVDVEQCKAKWRLLRDSYVKSRKKSTLLSESVGGLQREWKFEKIMSFLLPYLRHRRTSRRNFLTGPQTEVEGERPGSPLSLTGQDEPPGTEATRSTTPSPAPSLSLPTSTDRERPSRSRSPRERTRSTGVQKSTRDTRRATRQRDTGDRLLPLLEELVPKPYMPDTELDESYHFALSIVPMLKRLDKNKRHQAKLDILNTLYCLEYSQQQRPAPTQLLCPKEDGPLPEASDAGETP